jgi:hypothetical protein
MPQTGKTPIQLYRTATAAAAPANTDLVAGELAINYDDADMALYAKNESNTVKRIMNNPAGLKYPIADGTVGQPVTTDGAGNLAFGGTGALQLPVGTTAQRPTVASGLMRMNSTTGCVEWYSTAEAKWVQLARGLAPGDAFGGGYFAGYISTAGTGIADYMLIVAPKTTGETTKAWDSTAGGSDTSADSLYDGPTNSAALAAGGARYAAATWCEGLTINGYSDWYLPARNELEVAYYNLKNVAEANYIAGGNKGSNANAVPPNQPVSTEYTALRPPQTSVLAFRVGGPEAFADDGFWSSTEYSATDAWAQNFLSSQTGYQYNLAKTYAIHVRAFRRLAL